MRSWFERVRCAILDAPSPVLIEAGHDWGVPRIVASLRDPEQPLLWIDLREVDCSDDVAVGDAVSEAVRRGLGSPLFGLGIGVHYALSALESFLSAIEPLTVAVTGSERRTDLVDVLTRIIRPPNRLVVHTAGKLPRPDDALGGSLFGEEYLRVTPDEAIDLFGADRERADIERAVQEADGALGIMEDILMIGQAVTGVDHASGEAVGTGLGKGASGVVDALVVRKRWIEAFEFAVDHAPTRVREVLDEAGNSYFEQGQFDRFWRYISDVPRWALRDERSMYWLFNAAMAVNRWRQLIPQVDSYLETHEAPDLRARRATAEVNDASISEALRAHHAKQSPETARALAFIREFRGELDDAAQLYRDAIELAEATGRPRHVVGASAGMSQVHMFAGQYERAHHWAAWAVRQYQANDLREELLRISVVGMCAYAQLLVGAVHLAKQVLETVRVHESLIGIPTIEGVVSTLGDLALVENRYEDAIHYYRMNLEGSSRQIYPTLANDLVMALLHNGESEAAVAEAAESSEIAELSTAYQRTVANLSLGSALATVDPSKSERLLRDVLNAHSVQPLGPHRAQGAMQLGRLLLRQGRTEEARRLMEEHSRFISELGDSGWLLLGGQGPEIVQLKRMFRSGEPEIQLRLLGKRYLRNRDVEETLSLRFAELLTVLASNPNGVRGEQLALALYGDRANASTLKATISRARKLVPIGSQPYRIGEPCQADFMEVMELLRTGRVQAALELYRGPLLPESDAPAVVDLREHLEESLRQAVLASGDADAMIDLANQQGDDLELWEETRRHLPPNDPRRPLANARIRRIRKRWGSELG